MGTLTEYIFREQSSSLSLSLSLFFSYTLILLDGIHFSLVSTIRIFLASSPGRILSVSTASAVNCAIAIIKAGSASALCGNSHENSRGTYKRTANSSRLIRRNYDDLDDETPLTSAESAERERGSISMHMRVYVFLKHRTRGDCDAVPFGVTDYLPSV